MIDHNNRIIFIHIAKTGGSSVTQFYGLSALEECRNIYNWEWEGKLNEVIFPRFNAPYSDGVHDGIDKVAKAVKHVHGLSLDAYHKFAVIRKPADYVRSCWNEWHTERFPSFDGFITGGWYKGVINPQVRHHLMIDNHIMVDRLFLFEQLPEVFEHIRDLLNFHEVDDIHANRKVHDYTEKEVPEWMVEEINNFFWEDYNIYETLKRNK